jgi:hypothetical protein
MATLTVGPNSNYHTVSAAVAASSSGDVIDVTSGTYTNDFPTISHNLTLQAVGGPVRMVATESPPNGKAIIDEGGPGVNVSITGFTFTGASVPDNNGAGIRYEGGKLTLDHDIFDNNQEGLLGAPDPNGSISVQNSYFYDNGAGDGYSHDIYVGAIASFTANNSYFAEAKVGHEIKSRAASNTITNNVIGDGPTGTASYEIDLPNGGKAVITGNTIEKGANAQNSIAISYGEEGNLYSTNSLHVSGNTIIDDYSPSSFTAVRNSTSVQAQVTGNKYYGFSAAQMTSGPAKAAGNTLMKIEPPLPHPTGTASATAAIDAANTVGGSMQLLVAAPTANSSYADPTAVPVLNGPSELAPALPASVAATLPVEPAIGHAAAQLVLSYATHSGAFAGLGSEHASGSTALAGLSGGS